MAANSARPPGCDILYRLEAMPPRQTTSRSLKPLPTLPREGTSCPKNQNYVFKQSDKRLAAAVADGVSLMTRSPRHAGRQPAVNILPWPTRGRMQGCHIPRSSLNIRDWQRYDKASESTKPRTGCKVLERDGTRMAGRSAAWLAHLLWEQRVAGSNPAAPIVRGVRRVICPATTHRGR